MANQLFWLGVLSGCFLTIRAFFMERDIKSAIVAFPFLMLLAAAVAKYIGI